MTRVLLLMAALQSANVAAAEMTVKGRPALVLEGAAARVVVDLLGGSITDFHLQGQDTNPLDWGRERVWNGPGSMGHFLCLDRWASVSEAEAKNGMPGHGEATAVVWRVVRGPEERDGFITAEMTAELPLAGLAVRRVIRLDKDRAFFTVREEVENIGKLGRAVDVALDGGLGFLQFVALEDAGQVQKATGVEEVALVGGHHERVTTSCSTTLLMWWTPAISTSSNVSGESLASTPSGMGLLGGTNWLQ